MRSPSPPDPGDDEQTPTDPLASALAAALDGDEHAFRVLYRGLQPGLVRYLHLLVGADAEDVASETWLQVCRDLPTFAGDIQGFRAWCATVARHRAMDHLRRLRRRPVTVDDDRHLAELSDGTDPARSADESDGTRRALALIASLPPDQAEAVLLRVVVGLDATAAARVLGKRPGAVRTAAHRGLRRLAETLERRRA